MPRRFTRTIEDFQCSQCGTSVTGDGYTNHCPACLWSLHVDVQPGDRAAICRAPMRPVDIRYERGGFVIVHKCTTCGHTKPNRTSPDDDLSAFW